MFSPKSTVWTFITSLQFKFLPRKKNCNLKNSFIEECKKCNVQEIFYKIFSNYNLFRNENNLIMADEIKNHIDNSSSSTNIMRTVTEETSNLEDLLPNSFNTNVFNSAGSRLTELQEIRDTGLQSDGITNLKKEPNDLNPNLASCPLVNGTMNTFSNQYGFSCVPYLPFSQCVLQNQHERITHLPTQNFMKYDLCRTEMSKELHQKTKTKGKSVKALRQWKHSRNNSNSGDSSRKKGFIFKLVCYNVLAQSLLEEHTYLYQHHEQENLKWMQRWKILKQEITEQDPDIFCMQEVQETHLQDYFINTFNGLGYKSLYKKRTGYKVDGCAIFWKNDILDLLEYETVEFNQNQSTAVDRDNVAIIAKFVPRLYPTAEFIVATTHLLYNPRRENIRMAQVQLLLTEIDRLAYKTTYEKENDPHPYIPVILTGDFNTQPFSPVYELITSGKFEYQYHHLFKSNRLLSPHLGITDTCQHIEILKKRLSKEVTKTSEKNLTFLQHRESNFYPVRKTPFPEYKDLFSTGQLSHQLKLTSVFRHYLGGKCEATTYQDQWVTVDYIFYSNVEIKNKKATESKLKVISRYTIPTEDQLGNVKIPNSEVGSDHLLLAARFIIKE